MAATRHSRPSHVRIESKVHKAWRTNATEFHQNMLDGFCSGPSKTGYHVVSNRENHLDEKIKIAIFGCDRNTELTEEEEKIITDMREKIVKHSPEVYRKNGLSALAIVYVHLFLNNDNATNENHVLVRIPKFPEKNDDGDKKEKEEKVNFTVETVKIEYASGKKTVYDLKDYCDSAYFIDSSLRVYDGCKDYKKKNPLPKGSICWPVGGVYKAGEDGQVLVETVDTPACKEGAVELLDASNSIVGNVGAAICVASAFTPITAVVCWGALGCMTASSLYSCGRGVGKLVDRANHEQDLSLSNKEARNLWIDTVVSGAVTVAGCRTLAKGFMVLSANSYKLASSEVTAVWSRNSSIIITASVAGVLQVILTRVIDNIILNNWNDIPSLKNLFCLFLNVFSPVEQFEQALSDIVTITKPIFKCASSVKNYLSWSFDKFTTAIGTGAEDLKDMAVISGKFLFNVVVGVFEDEFAGIIHDYYQFMLGEMTVVEYAEKIVQHAENVWAWFERSFENSRMEYNKLCNEKKAKNIISTVYLNNNEENQRKMFFELEGVIKVCEVDNRDNKQMEILIELVDHFRSRLPADSTFNEFLYSVKVVCTFVKSCFRKKKNEYEDILDFEKGFDDDFNEDKFNKQFGLGKDVDPATHFFAQVVASLKTENGREKMLEKYNKNTERIANTENPSIRTEGFEEYLFMNPSEVTDVSQDNMWQQLFRAKTGIVIDGENVQMERKDTKNNRKIIIVRPKTNNFNFVLAYFIIREETPNLKGILSVCTLVQRRM